MSKKSKSALLILLIIVAVIAALYFGYQTLKAQVSEDSSDAGRDFGRGVAGGVLDEIGDRIRGIVPIDAEYGINTNDWDIG